MTDLELIKKCAERMGLNFEISVDEEDSGYQFIKLISSNPEYFEEYNPLNDDEQAMALVIWLALRGVLSIGARHLSTIPGTFGCRYWVDHDGTENGIRRAIVECVAKMDDKKRGKK